VAVTHPAVDMVTDRAAVVLQERPVVPLSRWLADAVATAAADEKLVQVVTPGTSRLTLPLAAVLGAVGGRRVVRSDAGYYDGLRGELLAWDGAAFQATGAGATPGYGSPALPPAVSGGTVRIEVTVLHPASEALVVGRLVELCVDTLTGGPPLGWGVAEPATQPWSYAEVTAYCRRRAPQPSTVVVTGRDAVGLLRVSRRPSAVVEKLTLAAGGTGAGPDLAAVDRLAVAMSGARMANVRLMVATLHPGRSDTTVEPRFTGWPVPYGVLVGPEPVAEYGVEHARAAPAASVLLTGPATRPLCWCLLIGSPSEPNPSNVLADVLAHFGAPGR